MTGARPRLISSTRRRRGSARHVAGELAAAILQNREERVNLLEGPRRAGAILLPLRPHQEVLLDRHPGEELPALRYLDEAACEDLLRIEPRQILAGEGERAGCLDDP
jgi:hypothetical protein